MKKIFLLISSSLSVLLMDCSNDEISSKDVPALVQATFNERFPGASDVEWENAKENNEKTYEAKFDWKGKRMEAEFEGGGTLIKMHEK